MNITIEGVIGVGKSTLIADLAQKLPEYHIIHEPVADNPYLADYYLNPKRWSLSLQTDILSFRTEEYRKALANGLKVITDRGIYGDRAFCRTIYRMGLISAREHQTYLGFHEHMVSATQPVVDTILYLRAKPEIVWERIKHRNRGEETGLDREYFDVLCYEYDKAMLEAPTRVITVDWNEFKPTSHILDWLFH